MIELKPFTRRWLETLSDKERFFLGSEKLTLAHPEPPYNHHERARIGALSLSSYVLVLPISSLQALVPPGL